MDVKQAVEAVLFASDEPVSVGKLHELIPGAKPADIREAVRQLKEEYDAAGRAFSVEEIAEGVQVLTRPEYADIIARLTRAKAEKKLSAAALEVLALVAYKQPIKRADIEAVRGVQSGEILRALMERKLVRVAGREDVPGAPVQYGTTKEFLEAFGLRSLEDLPRPEEMK
ncbi:MAG: SMC-Scp complex subunit ScpB [Planctomycetes bacterium]|nr:SMC-Scp complex subunit ScpB [Planctomycetota bacterium]